jgi:cysteine-rich repeat protein
MKWNNDDCVPICGDGLHLSSEICDDGNLLNEDGCDENCEVETDWSCQLTGGAD